MRLSNPDVEQLRQATRVQSEAACSPLANDVYSLTYKFRHHPPRLCLKGNKIQQLGCILEQSVPRKPLLKAFAETVPQDNKRDTMAQMARIFKAIQYCSLPQTNANQGGVALGTQTAQHRSRHRQTCRYRAATRLLNATLIDQ
jgi:hypothetical protein